ncbi:hypothetical protein WME90_16605 [Sorangium sp. So ce375]|uniref:hypothetical protein n=1 Tax=Sorangium sp. So ce375 TaxID=3133306 RepID=UPI003F5BA7CB
MSQSVPRIRYLLDTNAVIPFQRAGCLKALVAAAKSVPMAIADDVLGRIIGLHALLRVQVERGALSAALARAVAASRDLDPPLWWTGWTTSLPPEKP